MRSVEWVVKASKFCNLRCAYCYEWNDLGDRARISHRGWLQVMEAVRDYHLHLERRLGVEVESRVIWHGGEPLSLPVGYLDEVMALQHEVLAGLRHRLLLQSNLYRLPDATLEVLVRHGVGLGISMDVFGGVRLDRNGRRTEAAVVENLDRLDHQGISYGAITVLARHNHRRLREVHDFWARRGVDFRVLPLFAGPSERPPGMFEVSDEEIVTALNGLFDHWLGSGAAVDTLPLSEWLRNVVREILEQPTHVYDRRRWGESVLLVETNGDLHQTDERGSPELRLGNVIAETIDQILAGPAYAASLRRSEDKTSSFCHSCPHYGFCDGYPVHAEPVVSRPAVGCPVTSAVHDHIKSYLLDAGYDRPALSGLL